MNGATSKVTFVGVGCDDCIERSDEQDSEEQDSEDRLKPSVSNADIPEKQSVAVQGQV